MNLLALIKPAFTVLKHGSSLSKPDFWANVGGVLVLLLAVRDGAKVFFPEAALISDDVVSHGAGLISGLAGAYLLYASNKEAGIKPLIELVAVSEPESQNETTYRPIPEYQPPADGRWVHQPKVQSESSAAPESVQPGFNDQ